MTATTLQAQMLIAAVGAARANLAVAEAVDINDGAAVIRSQAALTGILRRVLWALNELDSEPDVAAQVAAEDGVWRIGIPVQRNGSVAA